MVRKKAGKRRRVNAGAGVGTKKSTTVLGLVLLLLIACMMWYFRDSELPVWSFEVVETYRHDPDSYTQGLVYEDGYLYESTGQYGQSKLRKVHLETGAVYRQIELAPSVFGEGLTLIDQRLIQLTWKEGQALVYHAENFRTMPPFSYRGEGWGLTHDRDRLIMSDGSDRLTYRDVETFEIIKEVPVTHDGIPLKGLNELEYVEGEIWANIYQSERIARIAPESGRVLAWINLAGLLPREERYGGEEVLNGIAYDPEGQRIFVTGKKWDKLFQIRLKRTP